MKKKIKVLAPVLVLIIVLAAIYFRPISLSNFVGKDVSQICVTCTSITFDGGERIIPIYNSEETVSEETLEKLKLTFSKYHVHRSIIPFSNNSEIGCGNYVDFFILDSPKLSYLSISDNGKIQTDKWCNYRINKKDAKEFTEEIAEILGY